MPDFQALTQHPVDLPKMSGLITFAKCRRNTSQVAGIKR
jgi:hypothetical protein